MTERRDLEKIIEQLGSRYTGDNAAVVLLYDGNEPRTYLAGDCFEQQVLVIGAAADMLVDFADTVEEMKESLGRMVTALAIECANLWKEKQDGRGAEK